MRRQTILAFFLLSALVFPVAAQAEPTQTQPSVIKGTPATGQFLTCSLGSWSSNPSSYVYRWIKKGVVGPWVTNSTFQVQATDAGEVSCQVKVFTAEGEGVGAPSAPVIIPELKLEAVAKPTMFSFANPVSKLWYGNSLECRSAKWSGPVDLPTKIQWLRNGKVISNYATYTIDHADMGQRISCRETATYMGLSASADSDQAYIKIKKIKAVKRARLIGYAVKGDTMECRFFEFSPKGVPVTFEWLRNGKVLKNSNYAVRTWSQADVGKKFACRAIGRVGKQTASTTSQTVKIRRDHFIR